MSTTTSIAKAMDTTNNDNRNDDDVEKHASAGVSRASYGDIFRAFILMGWTAFGGPAAHIGIFQKVFVDGKKWISSTIFAELLSLGQCMPGPTSTQVSFCSRRDAERRSRWPLIGRFVSIPRIDFDDFSRGGRG